MSEKNKQIFIVSDATGKTCERVSKAVLTQFESSDVDLHIWSYVRSPEAVEKVLRAAEETDSIIVYTLICPEERKRMEEMSKKLSVTAIDLMGPLLLKFAEFLGEEPKTIPGLYQELLSEDW